MHTSGRVLIVDDDQDFLNLYRIILGNEGYDVECATEADEAREKLASAEWDVVLLDQKLRGPGGPDTGLDLNQDVLQLSPGARPIIVTAYAGNDMVIQAFEAGAYDYLEKKGRVFEALLRAKVRNAVEVSRAQRLGDLDAQQLEARVRSSWEDVLRETDNNRKGRLLEEFMALLFKTIQGFQQVRLRRRNELEEIDLTIRNESSDPIWQKESPFFLAECKNWSKPVGVPEIQLFEKKLSRRFNRCKIGFFVAPAGFARTVRQELMTGRERAFVIVAMDHADVESLINAGDRNAVLKDLYERAVLAANGRDM